MTDAINVEITTEQPVVAATLDELRYLVFQGMVGETGQSAYELAVELGFVGSEEDWIASLKGETGDTGPTGAPGTTLGWDVTDDGEGNVEMTYPEAEFGDLNAVRFIQQTLTSAQKAQARENIGAADADANYSVRYNVAQVLEVAQKAQARENIGAASAEDLGYLDDDVAGLESDILALEDKTTPLTSDENVLAYHWRDQNVDDKITGGGFIFSLNATTGAVTITENRDPSVLGYLYCRTTYDFGANALVPPAGVYRLELRATSTTVDFTRVTGRLYLDNGNRIEITGANGKTAEIYLDGTQQVVVNVNADRSLVTYVEGEATQPTAYTATVTPVLHRIGASELAVEQASDDNALLSHYHWRNQDAGDAISGGGFVFELDETTGKVDITENRTSGVNGYRYCRTTYGYGYTNTFKPPAGIYRLELESDQFVDFTGVYGRFYYGITSRYIDTDATGKSIEVYLDGSMQVVVNVQADTALRNGSGALFTATVKPVLRKIGAPETSKLLVDQINQMRALQRKTMAVLDTVTKFYKVRDSVATLSKYTDKIAALMDNDQFYVNYAGDILAENDLNSLMDLPGYRLIVVTYNAATLNTPATANLTGDYTRGVVFHYHRADSSHGIDIAIVPGGGQILKRRIHSGTIEAWTEVT